MFWPDFFWVGGSAVLAAFRMYYATAELSGLTDPHMAYDLRTKLDGAGAYDVVEIERIKWGLSPAVSCA